MKKFIGLMVLAMAVVVAPIGVEAKTGEVVPKCDKSCPTEDGKCTSTCQINVTGNAGTLTTFTANLQIPSEGVTVKSLTVGDGWEKVSPTDSELSGSSIPLSFISASGVTTENFTIATVILEIESAQTECSLKVTNPSIGSEVTVEIETTTETKTGAAIPIAILSVGVVGAVVIYSVTKKNKKMYKI